ncbi:BSD-domain protein, putative [Hepatocystis sp. ex Piliocolobus tephrosceles]|nr:BSD-domain protein, putative [Hepatocystis sp. ex Piliocolobus tephrosceles]
MGNKHARRKKYELCEIQYDKEFELKYPWDEIIEWASSDLNVCMDITIIKKIIEEIKDITLDENNFLNITEGNSIDFFNFDDTKVSWAMCLLKEITNLKTIRYNIVPKLISENDFWLRYFATIKIIVIKNFLDSTKS